MAAFRLNLNLSILKQKWYGLQGKMSTKEG